MIFKEAVFSVKYNRQLTIRRCSNAIEDALKDHYMAPLIVPIPDTIDPAAPRIIAESNGGHSKITFSQISVDFNVRFDNEYASDFDQTENYIKERVKIILEVLKKLGINRYLYCGVTYNMRLDIKNDSPINYMTKLLGKKATDKKDTLYEASRRVVTVIDDKYFVNEDTGTYREFREVAGDIPELFVTKTQPVSQGVVLSLDINNRYQHIYQAKDNLIENCQNDVDEIFSIMRVNINEWE